MRPRERCTGPPRAQGSGSAAPRDRHCAFSASATEEESGTEGSSVCIAFFIETTAGPYFTAFGHASLEAVPTELSPNKQKSNSLPRFLLLHSCLPPGLRLSSGLLPASCSAPWEWSLLIPVTESKEGLTLARKLEKAYVSLQDSPQHHQARSACLRTKK